MDIQRIIDKAEVLVEALPRIRKLAGRRVVIKYGGAAMTRPELKDAVMQDVALMKFVGMNPIVVHGGGPEISSAMAKLGKEPLFIDGLRVTDAETMEIVQMALVGKVNREVVGLLAVHGARAVGLSGHDGRLVRATRRHHTGLDGRDVDLGFVGNVDHVDTTVIETLEQGDCVPVIAPVGMDQDGQAYNINADTVAGAIAAAVEAEQLILLTDVEGVRRDPEDPATLIGKLRKEEVRAGLEDGSLSGGMIPKLKACLTALEAGVGRVHITDGRVPHVLLLGLFTDRHLGTLVVR